MFGASELWPVGIRCLTKRGDNQKRLRRRATKPFTPACTCELLFTAPCARESPARRKRSHDEPVWETSGPCRDNPRNRIMRRCAVTVSVYRQPHLMYKLQTADWLSSQACRAKVFLSCALKKSQIFFFLADFPEKEGSKVWECIGGNMSLRKGELFSALVEHQESRTRWSQMRRDI